MVVQATEADHSNASQAKIAVRNWRITRGQVRLVGQQISDQRSWNRSLDSGAHPERQKIAPAPLFSTSPIMARDWNPPCCWSRSTLPEARSCGSNLIVIPQDPLIATLRVDRGGEVAQRNGVIHHLVSPHPFLLNTRGRLDYSLIKKVMYGGLRT